MRFRATIMQTGKTAAGIRISDHVVEGLESGRRAPVRITINGHTYRSSLATIDGRAMVGISAENREKAGVVGGDEVDIEIEVDTQPREVTVPPDFAAALDREPEARRFFDGLAHSVKVWHVLSVEGSRTPETRGAPDREVGLHVARGRAR